MGERAPWVATFSLMTFGVFVRLAGETCAARAPGFFAGGTGRRAVRGRTFDDGSRRFQAGFGSWLECRSESSWGSHGEMPTGTEPVEVSPAAPFMRIGTGPRGASSPRTLHARPAPLSGLGGRRFPCSPRRCGRRAVVNRWRGQARSAARPLPASRWMGKSVRGCNSRAAATRATWLRGFCAAC